ncbi:hypothetical protein ACFLWX_02785 [Chloroflexota bacterium]
MRKGANLVIHQTTDKLQGMPTYSEDLGLDLGRSEDRFKWLLASILFAKRISHKVAMATFQRFQEEGVNTPEAILAAGWDRLVQILDEGGYVRYDFSTASNLLDAMNKLTMDFGSLEGLNAEAKDARELENSLGSLKGIGPVAVNIFLRELRSLWPKADPDPSPVARRLAGRLGMSEAEIRKPRVESALVKIYLDYCKKRKCSECMVKEGCYEA